MDNRIILWNIKSAKLTATILHQWIGEWFRLFILDYCTVFATLYV